MRALGQGRLEARQHTVVIRYLSYSWEPIATKTKFKLSDWLSSLHHTRAHRRRTDATTMASILMRRRLASTSSRLSSSSSFSSPCLAGTSKRAALSTSAVRRQAEPVNDLDPRFARTQGAKKLVEMHTVEDLSSLSPVDVLAETGTKRESQMRHFTGMFISLASRFEIVLTFCVFQLTLGERVTNINSRKHSDAW